MAIHIATKLLELKKPIISKFHMLKTVSSLFESCQFGDAFLPASAVKISRQPQEHIRTIVERKNPKNPNVSRMSLYGK